MLKVKYLLVIGLPLLVKYTSVYADPYIALGHGFRGESGHIALGYKFTDNIAAETAFYSMGDQPPGFENINRMAELNVLGFTKFNNKLLGFGKFGANNTKWSHNGTNDYDRSNDSLWGWHGGVGIELLLKDNLSMYAQATTYQYRQVNNPNMGGYTYSGLGFRYTFKDKNE